MTEYSNSFQDAATTRKGTDAPGIGNGLGHQQVGDIRLRGRTPCLLPILEKKRSSVV